MSGSINYGRPTAKQRAANHAAIQELYPVVGNLIRQYGVAGAMTATLSNFVHLANCYGEHDAAIAGLRVAIDDLQHPERLAPPAGSA